MRLLLLEDEPGIRTPLTRAIRRWGHHVDAVGSIAEARHACAQQAPEGLVSDLKLPDGSGLDLAVDLRVPFVLMSGYGVFEDAVVALRHGCVDFLTKPVAMDNLKNAVERLGRRVSHGDDPLVMGSGSHQLMVPNPNGFEKRDLKVGTVAWTNLEEARNGYDSLSPLCDNSAERQMLAELLQMQTSGTLTLNASPARLRVHATGLIDSEDRRDVFSLLADTFLERPDGVMVEVHRG